MSYNIDDGGGWANHSVLQLLIYNNVLEDQKKNKSLNNIVKRSARHPIYATLATGNVVLGELSKGWSMAKDLMKVDEGTSATM